MSNNIRQAALSDLTEIDGELDRIASEKAKLEGREAGLNKRKAAWVVILGDDYPIEIISARMNFSKTIKQLSLGESPPFWEIVNQAASKFADQFSTPDIEKWLIENNMMPDIKQPRARIKMALKQLEDKGYVEKTFVPERGIAPHRYKATDKLLGN